jgi:hypothetical protein
MTENVDTWAYYVGTDRPETPWLLHPCDVWVANPHYTGPSAPHPEEARFDDEAQGRAEAPEKACPWQPTPADTQASWNEAEAAQEQPGAFPWRTEDYYF